MGLVIGGSAALANKVVIDAWESWNGMHPTTNLPGGNAADFASSAVPSVSPSNIILISATSGAVGGVAWNATAGRFIQTWASAAAQTSMASAPGSAFVAPMGRKFAIAGAVPAALLPPMRRFRVDFLARMSVVGTSELVCGFADTIGGPVNGNNPFAMWSSRPGTNGGRWMPRYRPVAAGAITDGADSGFSNSVFRKLSVIYEEGLNPRIRWLINDVEIMQVAGDANMPTPVNNGFLISKGLSSPINTTAEFCETRFICETL